MQLLIASPSQKKEHVVNWVEIDTLAGNFIIQGGHAPMVIQLQPDSKIRFCLSNGKQQVIDIKAGIVHITRQSMSLLLDK